MSAIALRRSCLLLRFAVARPRTQPSLNVRHILIGKMLPVIMKATSICARVRTHKRLRSHVAEHENVEMGEIGGRDRPGCER